MQNMQRKYNLFAGTQNYSLCFMRQISILFAAFLMRISEYFTAITNILFNNLDYDHMFNIFVVNKRSKNVTATNKIKKSKQPSGHIGL